jgi:hypothetical protein
MLSIENPLWKRRAFTANCSSSALRSLNEEPAVMVSTGLVGSVVGKSKIVEGDYCATSAFSYNQDSTADIDNKSTKVPCALLCRYGTGWIGTSLS